MIAREPVAESEYAALDLRVPPNDETSERAVIAAVLTDGRTMFEALPAVARALDSLCPSDFYVSARAAIWRAMQAAHQRGVRPECIAIRAELSDDQRDELVACVALRVTPANVEHYADRVRELARRRALLMAGQQLIEASHRGGGQLDIEALLSEALRVTQQTGARVEPPAHAWRAIEQTLSEPDRELVALWPGIVFSGAFSLFAALPKTGKTWLLIAWIASLVRNGSWLGFSPLGRSVRVLLVTEEPLFIVKAQARMFGIERGVDVLTLDGIVSGTPWPELVGAAAERATETGAEVLIFDTISTLAGMEDENSASDVNAALRPLLIAARTHDLGVVGVHHAAKSGGIRGSTVFEAVPDVLVEVGHGTAKRQRVLAVRSRLEGAPEDPVKVEWLPPMGEVLAGYRLIRENAAPAPETEPDRDAELDDRIVREVKQAVAEGGEPIVAARIVERIGRGAGRIRGRLPILVAAGRLGRQPGSGRGGGYVYGPPDHAAEPVPENEPVPNLSREPVQPVPTCPSPVPCGSEAGSPNLSNLPRGAVSPRAGAGASSGTLLLGAVEPEDRDTEGRRPDGRRA